MYKHSPVNLTRHDLFSKNLDTHKNSSNIKTIFFTKYWFKALNANFENNVEFSDYFIIMNDHVA